jgi:uncharacterized protein YdeI (YjbR/CyaY-like superfamily)
VAELKAARRGDDAVEAFVSADAFEDWLAQHHQSSRGIWLKLAKKGCAEPSISYGEAVEVALCFGWIDGQKDRWNDQYWLQRFTPRSPRSRWSKVNREKAEQLVTAGRMRPAGTTEIDRARLDGRWDAAYDGQRTAKAPEDLQRALDRDPEAAAAFAALDSRNRYSIIFRINDAKRPETRAKRVAKYIDMLRQGGRLHP